MRQGRWIAVAAGLAAGVTLVAPAGAGVKSAASDKAILKAAVLTAADVPSTWVAAKQADSGSKNYKGIAACKQIAAAMDSAHRGPRALSPQFTDPAPTSNALAQDTVYAFKSVKVAQQYLAPYEASNAASCYQQAFTRASGGHGQITVTPITNLQGVGDQAVGLEASITGTDQSGQPVHVIADVIGVRVGRGFAGFNFLNNRVVIPQGVAIVNAAVARLTSAVKG
jgi:hypothetical protein